MRLIGVALLSAAVLLSQVALTRVFSVAQTYHFAFLVISLALLGFGASGSLLALFPGLARRSLWPLHALGFAAGTVLGYLFLNHRPFDSYAIAWDPTQVVLLVANLLGLALPFLFAGALVGAMLGEGGADAGRIYGANLAGSGAGAVLAPLVISALGSERAVLASAALGAAAAVTLAPPRVPRGLATAGLAAGALAGTLALLAAFPPAFEIRPSPYKRISQVRLDPAARVLATRQDAQSRLDIVASPTLHSAQGLSLAFAGELPPQAGLVIDGDALLPVPDASRAPPELARSIPSAVAYALRPGGRTVLLGSGGGLEAWAARTHGAPEVTVVEPNRLVHDALVRDLRAWAGLADDPGVRLVHEQVRTFAERERRTFDVVHLPLAENFRPISSGAFTLNENYALTVEAFRSYLRLCGRRGLLVVTRWLQSPPSESLRTLGLLAEALDGRPLLRHVIAFRSFQTVTFIAKPEPFTDEETTRALEAIDRLRYDLVLGARMPGEMLNRYARLPSPVDHELGVRLAETPDRDGFYAAYLFEIRPPTDDHPFFFHFFRWQQTPVVLEELGRRWQPFGGSGYFVLLALLLFALAAAALLVLLPVALRGRFRAALGEVGARRAARALGYFTALGLAFLLVEVSLIQRFILVLGHPTLALATVVGALLLFSGSGSAVSARLPWRPALLALALLLAAYPWLTAALAPILLALPDTLRVMAVVLLVAPVGLLMGVPFPSAVRELGEARAIIPWAWAVNGSASVVAGVLTPMLSLSLGFTPVLLLGGALYLFAAGLAWGGGRLGAGLAARLSRRSVAAPPVA